MSKNRAIDKLSAAQSRQVLRSHCAELPARPETLYLSFGLRREPVCAGGNFGVLFPSPTRESTYTKLCNLYLFRCLCNHKSRAERTQNIQKRKNNENSELRRIEETKSKVSTQFEPSSTNHVPLMCQTFRANQIIYSPGASRTRARK